MIKTVLLVPRRGNDGRPFPRELWNALEDRLFQFGGLTRVPGIIGMWRVDNRTYRDQSRQYIVSLTSWTQLAAWLEVVDWARVSFGQEAMYVEVAGVPEVISVRNDPTPIDPGN